jgi:CubicO group peptidase (beta-lactamase class C family)
MIKHRGWLLVAVVLRCGVSSAEGADARTSRVDALFRDWIAPDAPGCALGVIRNGEFLYRNAYGMASLEYDVPLTTHSVFRTGSVGKQFTALAVLLAERQGKLSIDDDVRRFLPELPVTPEVITISNLIHHTSGIRDYLMLMSLAGKRDEDFYTEQEVLERLSRQEHLNFPPGTEYLYSNSGYFLLSQIILRATGASLSAFVRENIFAPLSMERTHFHDDFRMVVRDRAEGYRPRKGGGFEIDRTTLNMVGDGGVFTTIEDLARWDENFDSGRVGGKELAAKRLETGRLSDGTPETYAFGLRVGSYRGRPTVSHGGSFVGFRAATLRLPEDRFSVYVLCNRSDAEPEELALRTADALLFPDVVAATPPPGAGSPRGAADLQGVYYDAETGALKDLVLSDDGSLRFAGSDARLLGPVSASAPDVFRLFPDSASDSDSGTGVSVGFERPPGGKPRMTVASEGQRPFTYERVDAVHPGLETLARYLGLYRCRELDVTYRIELDENDHLLLVGPAESGPLPLEPLFEDAFRWREGSLVFARGREGRVSGFSLAADRARNFVFERL